MIAFQGVLAKGVIEIVRSNLIRHIVFLPLFSISHLHWCHLSMIATQSQHRVALLLKAKSDLRSTRVVTSIHDHVQSYVTLL